MDEDDDGSKGINLLSLFKLGPKDMPYDIDAKSKKITANPR